MQYQSHKRYTEAFKIEAVRRSLETHGTQRALARELGIHENMLCRWRRLYLTPQDKSDRLLKKVNAPDKSYKDLERENRKLKKQLERAETDIEILKKAQEYFAELRKNDSSSSR